MGFDILMYIRLCYIYFQDRSHSPSGEARPPGEAQNEVFFILFFFEENFYLSLHLLYMGFDILMYIRLCYIYFQDRSHSPSGEARPSGEAQNEVFFILFFFEENFYLSLHLLYMGFDILIRVSYRGGGALGFPPPGIYFPPLEFD